MQIEERGVSSFGWSSLSERIEGVMFGGHLPDIFCIVEIHKRKRERELVTVEINGNSLYSLSIFISGYDWTVNSPPRFQ